MTSPDKQAVPEDNQGASADADRAATASQPSQQAVSGIAGIPSAFTPGPWSIAPEGPFVTYVRAPNPTGHQYAVALVHPGWDRATNANARLIAAAPELLASLQEMCAKLDTIDGQPFVNPEDSYWARARAAIAKALGQ